nr:reverse transcriptase domain-containing protein [Tanacetum cinerariifolium]
MLRTCYGYDITKSTIIEIFYHGLDDQTQGILNTGGIFFNKTPNKAFKILEDKVLLKLDFSDDSQNPKPNIVVFADGRNIDSYQAILMEKFKALATKIDSVFLIIRKELKEMRDGRRDNYALQIYMSDDTPMCEPHEASYVQRYHEGYHDQNSKILYSNQNRSPNYKKILHTKSIPCTTNTKPRHEIVYKPPSIRNKNDKGEVAFIEEDEIKPILTMTIPKPINSNSPTVSPYLKDCTVHIPYTNSKTFPDDILLNHVGDKEFKSIDGIRNKRKTKNEINKYDVGLPKEHNKEWKLNEKVVPHNK